MKNNLIKYLDYLSLLLLLFFVESCNSSKTSVQCNREYLISMIDKYINAMVTRNPSGLPLAGNFKYTENTAEIPLGEGLWVGISEGPSTFKIYAADPKTGQAGLFCVVKEFSTPVILALRLKIEKGKITEIEHVIARNLPGSAMSNLVKPRYGYLQKVPQSERVPHKEMLRIANSYFNSIEQDNGNIAPFADNSERHENGIQTTTNKPPDTTTFGTSESEKIRLAFSRINVLNPRDQINCGILKYITKIYPRRLLIVDEEMGLVFGFPMFVHRGDVRSIKIIGVPGVDTIPMPFGPINLQAAEIFKISKGKIHEIEANGILLPYLAKSGWEN